jgi:Cu/Ag efflux protein CusF
MSMQIARLAVMLAALGIAGATRADEKKPTFHAVKSSTVTATVKSVDQQTRMVTLANEDGEITFKADDRVKNLAQMKPGDLLTATLTESLDARVLKKGESIPVASEGSAMAGAPLGQKPAGYAQKEVYVVATITKIDKKKNIVTLKGPKGNEYPIQAKDKNNVAKLKVGDNIEIHAVKALAVQVTTPQTPPK